DRDTSGVILVAKTNAVHLKMSEQFERRDVSKEYFALVIGNLQFDRDIIRQPIGPHPYQRDKMAIRRDHPDCREAETQYEVVDRYDGITSVRVFPKTGRTHQIRVHMAHVGTPVLCDRLYAGHSQITQGELQKRLAKKLPPHPQDQDIILNRQALHARRIAFEHPTTGQRIELESPLPADILQVQSILQDLTC
ncbi:MAG: RluA family pseudouridine synthase, partial [Planctomycetales bacterium]|nr:RluA family pseudouridine synthase [Planctomycetales bacterium]